VFSFRIIQIMSKTRVKRSIRFISSCHSPAKVFYVGAAFTPTSA
jgi:hypothetical protein